jgi:hypothetical protein
MECEAITDDEISLLKEIAKCKKLLRAAKDLLFIPYHILFIQVC